MLGLIVNPVSSKDIRRLVALGRVVPVEEKANLVARFLAGVGGGPPTAIRALDDAAGVTRRAIGTAGRRGAPVSWLPVEAIGTEADTVAAATALHEEGASLVVVVGGDGTLRAVVEGWPEVPLLLLPAGTNNAFASPVEPTVAGLAAAHATQEGVRAVAFYRRSRLVVRGPADQMTAVVDAVGVNERWIASRAIWRTADLVEAFVTRSDPSTIGMAAIAATFGPLSDGLVRYLRFGEGQPARAAFGPGLVTDVSVEVVKDLPLEEEIPLDPATRVVALDGERRVLEGPGRTVVGLPGPLAFDPGAALARAYGDKPAPGRE